jgi:hypothetical protein
MEFHISCLKNTHLQIHNSKFKQTLDASFYACDFVSFDNVGADHKVHNTTHSHIWYIFMNGVSMFFCFLSFHDDYSPRCHLAIIFITIFFSL